MTGRQIPSAIWKQADEIGPIEYDPATLAEAFADAAGMRSPATTHLVCGLCLRENAQTVQNAVTIIDGTSLCAEHANNMLN